MPRAARASVGGMCYHVYNCGNNRAEVFHEPDDSDAFLATAVEGCERLPMRVLAYCIMPSHFHLVLWPRNDGDLSRWMQWLLTAHVRRYHRDHGGSGHVWMGRFKAFPIQTDEHLLAVFRYVESNPVRANLAKRAAEWRWSSAGYWSGRPTLLEPHPGPVERGRNWAQKLNTSIPAAELELIRRSVVRGTPLGTSAWVAKTVKRLGLESTIRPRGRPRISR
ncbi:MAG: transposase [Isosphaeraceae bacterium]